MVFTFSYYVLFLVDVLDDITFGFTHLPQNNHVQACMYASIIIHEDACMLMYCMDSQHLLQ